jgi:hypothetical protein
MAANNKQAMRTAKAAIESAGKDDLPIYQLAILIEKANRGKENGQEVQELRKFIDEHPDMANKHCVVAYSVRHGLMRKVSKEPGNFELFEREYELRRNQLGWKDASPIEQLMIERIMLCWVRLLWTEHYNGSFMQPSIPMRESEYADKMFSRAHTRYVKAIESLARLRQVEAITKAANAHATLLEMKEKTTRARIEAAQPGLLSGDRGLKAVLQRRA